MTTNELINKLGLQLNGMQQAACKAILNDSRDIVILSPTGTGKTYAYLIPLSTQLDAQSDELQAIVLLPGRELALQSANVLKREQDSAQWHFMAVGPLWMSIVSSVPCVLR